ncbi:MAG TPA: hypothetical protein VFR79_12660, partial [Nitrospira sp.]|nr:hypothetical protein [Nitrospira sp.]
SPSARLDEHRLSKNTMDLVCAFGEQRRSTSHDAPPVAEPSRDTALRDYPSLEPEVPIDLPRHFAEPNSDRALRFHPSPEQSRPSTCSIFTLPGLDE